MGLEARTHVSGTGNKERNFLVGTKMREIRNVRKS